MAEYSTVRTFFFFWSMHQLDIWVVFTFWVLWIMQLWTFMYKFLCGHVFSVLLALELGVELLDHIVSLCLTFWRSAKMFSKTAAPFYSPTSSEPTFQFLFVLTQNYHYLIIAILVDVKWPPPCGFDVHFHNDYFLCLLAIWIIIFGKMASNTLSNFFNTLPILKLLRCKGYIFCRVETYMILYSVLCRTG